MPVTDYGAGADTSRFQLYFLAETNWGVTPAAALTELRVTGESLNLQETSVTSDEIRSDRQITDLVRTGFEPNGDVNSELSYGTFDQFFEGAFFGQFATVYSNTLTVTVADDAGTGGSVISDDGLGGVLGAGIAAGAFIRVAGLTTNAGENGFYRVESITDGDTIVVTPRITAVAGEAGVTIDNDGHLANGTTAHSFTLEKNFADVGQFFSFTGMMVSVANLDFSSESILTGSFTFMGRNGARAGATVGTGPAVAAPTTRVVNAVTNFGQLRENGVGIGTEATYFVQSVSATIDNGLRGQKAIGDAGNVGVGIGRATVTGSMTVYFNDGALYDRFVNETETQLSWVITDAAGNSYAFSMPRVKLSNAQVVAGGPDQDVLATFDFQALRDEVFGVTISMDRFALA
jgi:hypothetical protein